MTTIIKELSHRDLRAKLETRGILDHRPDLAAWILSGQCAYAERTIGQADHGETFALQGSKAATMTKDLPAGDTRSDSSPHLTDAEMERRMEEIRLRHAPRSFSAPPAASDRSTNAGEDLIRAAEAAADRDAEDAADVFLRSALEVGAGKHHSSASGDASLDFIRAAEAAEQDDFDPFDFGGAA